MRRPLAAILFAAALSAPSHAGGPPAPSPGEPAAPPAGAAGAAAPAVPDSAAQAAMYKAMEARLDSIEKSLEYRTGEIRLGDGLATAKLPAGYRYLDPEQASTVLTELWGNPPGSTTLGMIFPPNTTPLAEDSWAVIVSFDEDGYVKDDDAAEIDYDKLLEEMQESSAEENKDRVKAGYDPLTIVGWAEKPSYDSAANKLYWAKEIRFGDARSNTLNYNIRALGRRGVLVLNAVASMDALATVKAGMQALQPAVEFNEGHRYAEFDPKIDKVAAYGLAGLVAGTVLAKGGIIKAVIAALIAGKKFILIGLAALGAGFFKYFRGRGEERKVVKDEVKQVG